MSAPESRHQTDPAAWFSRRSSLVRSPDKEGGGEFLCFAEGRLRLGLYPNTMVPTVHKEHLKRIEDGNDHNERWHSDHSKDRGQTER
jgi:hypothetical protein